MNFEEFEKEGRSAYEELARTIRSIIETVASRSSDYRLQQVQCRAKGGSSLRQKLIDNDALESDQIETVIKDLAGCRVILYTNADVKSFVSSGVISDNFEVNWDRTKFHYPAAEPTAEDGFVSYNYVVRLKDDRLALPEYAPFVGMWCEVQVQTTLDHAWSEMAHDTIYKKPPPGIGKALMESVSERMTALNQKYLRPAGFEFQKVVSDVRALERARAVLATNPLGRLREATDNNARHEILGEFQKYLLPYYDDLPAVADEVRQVMVDTALAARATPTKPWEMHGYSFDGYAAHVVVASALEVINNLRFVSMEAVDATFAALAQLFPDSSDEDRRSLKEGVEKLAKHDMRVWQTSGPVVQQRLVALIGALSPEEQERLRPLVVSTLRHILSSDITGVSSTYNAFTFHQGAVVASDELLSIRRDAVSILEELFLSSTDWGDQVQILHAFEGAGRPPNHGQLTAKLYQATLDDTMRVVEFLSGHADELAFELLQTAEHGLLWKYRHTSALPPVFKSDAKVEASRQALRASILAFRDRINVNDDFVVYKTLVGVQSVFPLAWANSTLDHQGETAYREGEMDRLVDEIDDASFDRWLARIRRCAQTKSNDGATFPSFRLFLRKLGKANPGFLIRLFGHLDQDLDWFVADMLLGLEGGPFEERISGLTSVWLGEFRHLAQIAAFAGQSAILNQKLLARVARVAVQADDRRALSLIIDACIRRDRDAPKGLDGLFGTVIKHFMAKESVEWSSSVWFHADAGGLLHRLAPKFRAAMLDNLVNLKQLDYHAEELLNAVAGGDPATLLGFIRDRFVRERPEGDNVGGYEAIPFDFHRLRETFADHGPEVVAAARHWFDDGEPALFEFRGGAFVARLFPDFVGVGGALLELAREGGKGDLQFVLRTLAAFKGQAFVLPVCRQVVARAEPDSSLLKQVSYVLEQSGVISGEFGFVELYRVRKEQIAPWLVDPEHAVREFAQKRMKELDLAVAAEQRRSIEELELRKRQYGE